MMLWDDGEFVLSRVDASTRRVLRVEPSLAQPGMATLRKLKHAMDLRDELDSIWAARPVELTVERGRPALLVEDPGGTPLASLVGRERWRVERFLPVAVGLASTIGALHQRGLVHKDLKPSNIFVDESSGRVWLSGFGLTSRLPRERNAIGRPEVIAGTLAYIASEQTGRLNRSIDSRSDLYACGVILYKMLTGALPFAARDPVEWIHCHVARIPVPPSERVGNIPLVEERRGPLSNRCGAGSRSQGLSSPAG